MFSFLEECRLWHYMAVNIRKSTQGTNKNNNKFIERLETWERKNHQIITWIHNTFIPSIRLQFKGFDTTKKVL